MSTSNIRINTLEEMIRLEEERFGLQQQIKELIGRMHNLRDQLLSDESPAQVPAQPANQSGGKAAQPKPKTLRGELKASIYAALEAAGDAGVRVKDLALSLGTKPVNVYSWFHSTISRDSAIKKIDGGHYKLEQAGGNRSSAKKGNQAPAGKAKKGSVESRTGRGELMVKILEVMQASGNEGTTAAEVTEKIGVNPKNVSVWFATTGKKNKNIKRVGRGRYRLVK